MEGGGRSGLFIKGKLVGEACKKRIMQALEVEDREVKPELGGGPTTLLMRSNGKKTQKQEVSHC